MRNKKKRSENTRIKQEFKKQEEKNLVIQHLRQAQEVLENQTDHSEVVAVDDIPDNLFIACNLACPECGCEQLFESGGSEFPDYQTISYLCRDCRCEFEVHLEILASGRGFKSFPPDEKS
jgi:hypothetical protein